MSPSTAASLQLMPCEVRVSSSNMFSCSLLSWAALLLIAVLHLFDLTSEVNKVATLDHGSYVK